MASSFEKSVKGATKIKAAPPKTKYIEHILVATHADEAGVGEVFRALKSRLQDSTWTVVFKSLITVHLMIREGSPNVALSYLSRHRGMLAISNFTDVQTQGSNIRHYSDYLNARVRAYKETKIDWVRAKETRLEKLSVEKGLLRETEVVQRQINALLECDVLDNKHHEPENEITITVLRLLVLDLLALFQVLNQAMINILGHFFEMSKPDAERAMAIYRTFTRQTKHEDSYGGDGSKNAVQYLENARRWEHHTRVEIPKLKHAPTNLGRQLEDYLNDPDFEIHRRQYLAEQGAKKGGSLKPSSSSKPTTAPSEAARRLFGNDTSTASMSASNSNPPPPVSKGPEPDLIDFFDSIEQKPAEPAPQPQQQPQMFPMATGNPWPADNTAYQMQQPQQTGQYPGNGFMAQQQMPQQTGYGSVGGPFSLQQQPQQQPQPSQLQPNFTGAGFGGYTPQPSQPSNNLGSIPQNSVASFQTGTSSPSMQTGLQPGQQITNPFRASMMMANPTGMPGNTGFQSPSSPQTVQSGVQRHSTNPFARSSPQAATPFSNPSSASNSPFQSQQQVPPPQPQQPLQPMQTGTNPFAKNAQPSQQQQQRPQTSAGLVPQPTGSTNPFRAGAFVNHQTGAGWQTNQQPIGGGLDHLETTPVFPRPAQQTPWQQ